MNYVFFYLEIFGIIAFSISGSLVAINKKFDVFGVVVVGIITSFGGGLSRDIIVGRIPPTLFSNAFLIAISVVVSLLTFALAYVKRKRFILIQHKIECINNYFDAIGLAVFTITGVESIYNYGFSDNVLLCIGMGVLTGVGGGLIRDIFTNSSPYIFTKHFYAMASIIGATAFYLLRIFAPLQIISTIVGIGLIFILRLLATKFHWELPKAHIDED